MPPEDPTILQLLTDLFSAAFARNNLLSKHPTRIDSSDHEGDLDRWRNALDRLLLELRVRVGRDQLDPETRATLVLIVPPLEQIGRQPLPARTRSAIYSQLRSTLVTLSESLGEPSPDLPESVNGLLSRLDGAGRARRKPTGPLASREEELARRFVSGESIGSIAEDYGVSPQAVQQRLRRQGISVGDKRSMLDKRINELATAGRPVSAISTEVGLSARTVRIRLREMGIKPRRESAGPRLEADKITLILALRERGETIRSIAASTGIPPSTVMSVVKSRGSKPNSN